MLISFSLYSFPIDLRYISSLYLFYLQTKSIGVPESDLAGFTYDAVWTYGLALDKLFKEDDSYTSNLRSSNTTE